MREVAAVLLVLALSGCKGQQWGGPSPTVESSRVNGPPPESAPVEAPAVGEPGSAPGVPGATGAALTGGDVPATSGHPRLWLRASDLPRLRAWAASAGGVYTLGLRQVAERAKGEMDRNEEPFKEETCADASGTYACESYAELFAFMSLVSPSDVERSQYAARARTVLMRQINEAAKGATKTENKLSIRSADFSTDDRSRWNGEGFALTTDWIYGSLSAEDKKKIRTVFLRWCGENVNSSVTTSDHPEPRGVVNSPVLVKDRKAVRFASNNYFTAHMRNIGLMSMALDPKDDEGGKLRAYLKNATGAWLYMIDYLLKHDAKGGLGPEGFEYGPQTFAYVIQFLLAMHTAGEDVATRWGPQAELGKDAFWDDALTSYFHLVSPAPVQHPDLGPVYQPVWFGDGQRYWAPDFIDFFGAIGIHAFYTGNQRRLDMARFIQTHYPPGGAKWDERLRKEDTLRRSILYFLLFEPGAKVPDPRPQLPLSFFSPGLGHWFARTGWGPDASVFHWTNGWITIDHQHANGNDFAMLRKGEWLTKRRVGYGDEIAASDSHNTLALENDKPDHHGEGDYRRPLWKRGSQWIQGINNGDGRILARSETPRFIYGLGDASPLYNSDYEMVNDITHASRSIVWLKPDHVVVYDRATGKKEKHFKRFWLQLPKPAQVTGNVATMSTGRQKLFVTKLLPADGVMTSAPNEGLGDEPADLEPMKSRLKTEAPGGPRDVRFLHVLQGGEVGADPATLATVRSGAFDGAVVKGTALLFPRVPGVAGEIVYAVPAGTQAHIVTGLTAGASYEVATQQAGVETVVTVRAGGKGEKKADPGGVLAF